MSTIHHTSTRYTNGMQFISEIGHHSIIVDTVPNGGGEDTGPNPKPLILTALAGCTGMDVVGTLKKMRVPFSDFKVEADADLSDEQPRVYSEIRVNYFIKIEEKNRDKVERAVSLSKNNYCGVAAMLAKVCPVLFKINYQFTVVENLAGVS